MLVYNIKRSINILGVSDCQTQKMELTYKATACFVFITNILGFLKIVLQISYNLPKKQLALERLYCRLGYVLFMNDQKGGFSQPDVLPWRVANFVTVYFRLKKISCET
jgi:hypothetical protein